VLGAIFLAAVASMPTPEEVQALVKVDPHCAASEGELSGCEVLLEFAVVEVRDLTCNETEWPRELVCSSNVLFEERFGLHPSHWIQRADQLRLMEDGTWFLVQALSPPLPAHAANSASLP
jgi:hypothetical protein